MIAVLCDEIICCVHTLFMFICVWQYRYEISVQTVEHVACQSLRTRGCSLVQITFFASVYAHHRQMLCVVYLWYILNSYAKLHHKFSVCYVIMQLGQLNK